jgi:hypothetical protein
MVGCRCMQNEEARLKTEKSYAFMDIGEEDMSSIPSMPVIRRSIVLNPQGRESVHEQRCSAVEDIKQSTKARTSFWK